MIFGTSYSRTPYRQRARISTDSYGDPVEDWTAPDEVKIPRAEIQAIPGDEAESYTADELTNSRRLYVPYAYDLTAADRIRDADGKVWRVYGDPIVWPAVASTVYTSAELRRTEST